MYIYIYILNSRESDIHTFYNKTRGISNSILIIQTVDGGEYGGYSSTEWCYKGENYYGTGESFLFSYHTHVQDSSTVGK
jgi:hypothetical protein